MNWDEARLRFVVFLSGAVLMSLEILGSRVLAPSFGSSVYVWGSLITVFLAALAVGYALGGRLADRRPQASTISIVLSIAGLLVIPSVLWAGPLMNAVGDARWDVRWAALFVSLVLFLPPSLAIGMVSPLAVKLGVRQLQGVGTAAGRYAALSAAGSIAGTLLTAFVLIPSFPVPSLLLILAGSLALCAVLLMRGAVSAAAAGLVLLACAAAGLAPARPEAYDGEVLLVRDTAYHHIVVTQHAGMRWLRFDDLLQGGMYLQSPERPIFEYEQGLFLPFVLSPSLRSVCQVGLGTGSFPRLLARAVPEADLTTVEIDPVVREVALRHFSYAEGPRRRTVIQDGRVFLTRTPDRYDLIVLDAFNSSGVPFHLTTREFFSTVRRRLQPGGVFAANFIGGLMGEKGRLFWAAYRTIRREFPHVYLFNPDVAEGRYEFDGNMILVATDLPGPVSQAAFQLRADVLSDEWDLPLLGVHAGRMRHNPAPLAGVPELTDRYAPVEALQHF
jgi:spermidine synthase